MDLRIGERLKQLSGDMDSIQQKLPRPGLTPVYNLEIQDEHFNCARTNGALTPNVREVLWRSVEPSRPARIQLTFAYERELSGRN